MEFLCLGFYSSNVGLYTVPVTQALSIDRLDYSYWSSIRYAVQVVVALFFGNRFSVEGDLNRGDVNETLGKATDFAESIKEDMFSNGEDKP
jgi:hypothetical protein